jgi:hypothetical protein
MSSFLSEHIFENPDHTILFDQANLILHDKGIVQYYEEAVEIFCGLVFAKLVSFLIKKKP